MGLATLGPHTFRLDPTSIQWNMQIKSSVTNTLGGKVVQVYGAEVGDMQVAGSFGQGDWQEQAKFLKTMKGIAKGHINGPPVAFNYPPRGWSFQVYLTDYRSDSGAAVTMTAGTINPGWRLTLSIVEDNLGLKRVGMDAYLKRIAKGLGFKPSEFNGPITEDDQRAGLASAGVSSIRELFDRRFGSSSSGAGQQGSSSSGSSATVAGKGQPPGPGQEPNTEGMTDAEIVASIMYCIREVESGGNYRAINPTEHESVAASGAYQYITSTWNNYGGIRYARDAPPHVQDQRAREDFTRSWNQWRSVRKAIHNHFYPAQVGNEGYQPPGQNGGHTLGSYADLVLSHWGKGMVL